jgi:hypothetical protein
MAQDEMNLKVLEYNEDIQKLRDALLQIEQNKTLTVDPEALNVYAAQENNLQYQIESKLQEKQNYEATKRKEIETLQSKPNTLPLQPRKAYLVKWRGGSYKHATWEWAEAIDDDMKIALFQRIETPPSGVAKIVSRTQLLALQERLRKKQIGSPGKAKRNSTFKQTNSFKQTTKAPRILAGNMQPHQLHEKDLVRAKLELARFNRASDVLHPLRVPEALQNYACQLEVSGLAQPGDEIICVNGVRCTG